MKNEYPKTEKNLVKRGARRATYSISEINSVLDATSLCHIAFIHQNQAMVLPINFGRKEKTIYIHGSNQNRMTSALLEQGLATVSVTILDGLLLARSAFHHSVNYRSVVIFGKVREVISNEEKIEGLKTLINHVVPNRWEECRKPSAAELKATRVLAIDITNASAKIKNTPVSEHKEDLKLDHWAGEIPLLTHAQKPIPDKTLDGSVPISKAAWNYYLKHK